MRINRSAVLIITISLASFVGCGETDETASTCFLIDESGFVLDSVRPDPGYSCALTSYAFDVARSDTVRPDPGSDQVAMSKVGDGLRAKLQQIRTEELKRR